MPRLFAVVIAAQVVWSCQSPVSTEEDGSVSADGDADADADADESWVRIVSPSEGAEVANPVELVFETSNDVFWVDLTTEESFPLTDDLLPAEAGSFVFELSGTNRVRTVTLVGYGEELGWLAEDRVSFTPAEPGLLPEEEGFNRYVIRAINDLDLFPKDGSHPYCWTDACRPDVDIYYGMVHDGYYAGERLFEGTGVCYCCGHTLEIFLEAYRLYQEQNDLDPTVTFGALDVDGVNRGPFYYDWFGIDTASDAGAALEGYGIGEAIGPERWDEVIPGDFVMFSRSSGSGHAVIFVDWVFEGGDYAGLRYYSCNGSGDSHPDPNDPENMEDVSGPGFVTEHFTDFGGRVMPSWVLIGHPFDPGSL